MKYQPVRGRFLELTLATKQITPHERPWKTGYGSSWCWNGNARTLTSFRCFLKQEGNPWRPHPDWFLPQTLRTDSKGLTSISPHQVVPKLFMAPVRLSEVFEWKTMDTAKASFLRVIFSIQGHLFVLRLRTWKPVLEFFKLSKYRLNCVSLTFVL